jgi:3',5'-nucleoside bisphosphate phosphatase
MDKYLGSGFADLHTHTTSSDGTFAPAEVVRMAAECGLKYIAITDHDIVDGISEAVRAAAELDINIIPGVELSVEHVSGQEIHMLAYGIDWLDEKLNRKLVSLQNSRAVRAREIVVKLQNMGFDLDYDDVASVAEEASVGRPHIAQAMVDKGFIQKPDDAFREYIGWAGPAYVKKVILSPENAIDMISEAGGVAVHAHPGIFGNDDLIPELVGAGMAGIECFHPFHKETHYRHYFELCRKYDLLVTGGSDFHGTNRPEVKIGRVSVTERAVDNLLAKCRMPVAGL